MSQQRLLNSWALLQKLVSFPVAFSTTSLKRTGGSFLPANGNHGRVFCSAPRSDEPSWRRQVLQRLLEHGLDINAVNGMGETPLLPGASAIGILSAQNVTAIPVLTFIIHHGSSCLRKKARGSRGGIAQKLPHWPILHFELR